MTDPDLSTVQGRTAAFAEWFGLDPAPLTYCSDEPDQVLWTEALSQWAKAAGIDFNWLVIGDLKLMAEAYRRQRLEERRVVASYHRMDEDQARLFRAALKAISGGTIAPEDVMDAYQEALAELRAEKGEASDAAG